MYEYRLKIDELEPDTIYTINGYAYGEGNIKGKDTIFRDFKLKAGSKYYNYFTSVKTR